MPTLACRTCGRRMYMSDPPEAPLRDERRCPRCGASLEQERREGERRRELRRQNPPLDPGPPGGTERRSAERRSGGDRRTRS